MPWVRFTRDFIWIVPQFRGRLSMSFKKGMTKMVTTPCATMALMKGAAVRAKRPDRPAPAMAADAAPGEEHRDEIPESLPRRHPWLD